VPSLLASDRGGDVSVALLTAVLDQDTALIRAIAQSGYRGLVIEGLGGGHVSAAVAKALGEVARDIPVVYSSRTRAGAVLESTYGSPGAELDLIRRGCIPSGQLPALKARVLLTMLLRSYPREDAEAMLMAEGNAGR
jgi:L-asparaginase